MQISFPEFRLRISRSVDFFQRIGFTLNGEDHYDLEGSLTDNAKIEEFDETPWHDICVTDCYHGEKGGITWFSVPGVSRKMGV